MRGIPLVVGRGHAGHAPQVEIQGGRRLAGFDRAERIDAIVGELGRRGGFSSEEPRRHGREPVSRVHDESMLSFLELAASRAAEDDEALVFPDTFLHAGLRADLGDPTSELGFEGLLASHCFDTISGISPGTFAAALEAVDCALTAADHVVAGSLLAVALTRPPGHHASAALFGGGTFLNNAAIAAEYLRGRGADRVALLDLDIHHGNGSQSLFYGRPDVFFASVHASPRGHFPYVVGFSEETGSGDGTGFNLNVVLARDAAIGDYLSGLDAALGALSEFRATTLVVSLGVDGHRADPARAARLLTEDFTVIGAKVAELELPAVAVLEGGYDLDVLGPSVAGWLEGFAGGAPSAGARIEESASSSGEAVGPR